MDLLNFTHMFKQAQDKRLDRNVLVILFLIIVAGFVVRIYNLGSQCLFLDEGATAYFSLLTSIREMIKELSWSGQQPLYFILMRYWVNLFGKTEFILRIPSVLIGTVTLYMTFELGRFLFGKQVGLISACLTALSVFHINYSQEARPYILSALLSLFSVYFFVKVINTANIKNITAYIVSTLLLVYSHTSGVFIIIAQNLFLFTYLLFAKEKLKLSLKGWIFTQVVIFFLSTPCLYFLLSGSYLDIGKVKQFFGWVNKPTLITVLDTFFMCSSSSGLLSVIFFLLLLKLVLFPLPNNKYIYLLFLLMLSIPAFMFLVSKVWSPIYIQRYTLPSSIPFYILVSLSIYKLSLYRKLLILFIITSISIVSIHHYFFRGLYPFNYRQINTREIVNFIESRAKKNDLLIVVPFYHLKPLYNYYSQREDLLKKGLIRSWYKGDSLISPDDIQDSSLKDLDRIWLLLFHYIPEAKTLEKEIQRTHKLLIYKKYHSHIEVKLYEKPT